MKKNLLFLLLAAGISQFHIHTASQYSPLTSFSEADEEDNELAAVTSAPQPQTSSSQPPVLRKVHSAPEAIRASLEKDDIVVQKGRPRSRYVRGTFTAPVLDSHNNVIIPANETTIKLEKLIKRFNDTKTALLSLGFSKVRQEPYSILLKKDADGNNSFLAEIALGHPDHQIKTVERAIEILADAIKTINSTHESGLAIFFATSNLPYSSQDLLDFKACRKALLINPTNHDALMKLLNLHTELIEAPAARAAKTKSPITSKASRIITFGNNQKVRDLTNHFSLARNISREQVQQFKDLKNSVHANKSDRAVAKALAELYAKVIGERFANPHSLFTGSSTPVPSITRILRTDSAPAMLTHAGSRPRSVDFHSHDEVKTFPVTAKDLLGRHSNPSPLYPELEKTIAAARIADLQELQQQESEARMREGAAAQAELEDQWAGEEEEPTGTPGDMDVFSKALEAAMEKAQGLHYEDEENQK